MPAEEEPASPAARLMQQPDFSLCILAIMGFGTMIDVNVFKKCMEETLIKHPRFSSLLVLNKKKGGSLVWKRTEVAIEKHVFVPVIDPDMENPDKFVEDYTSGISANPLDLKRPLWEFHFLNVKTSDANSIAILKVHHSLGDGVSLISLLLACSKKSSDPESLPAFPMRKSRPDADTRLTRRLFIWFWRIFLVIFYTLIDCTVLVAVLLFLEDKKNPIKQPREVEMPPRRYVHRILNLNDIKLVKNAMEVTINDVVLGMSEAGLSRYLNMRYATTEKSGETGVGMTKKSSHLPRNLHIRSTVAFNLRPSTSIEDLADVMEKGKELKGMWGNLTAFALLPLTIDLPDDPLTHIRRAKATMDRKKLSLEASFTFFLVKIGIRLLGLKITAALARRFFQHSTLCFSNVVGPSEEIILFDHPLRYFAPSVWCPGCLQALTIHFLSYADKLVISISATDQIADPHQFCDAMVKSLESMKEAVIKKGLVKDSAGSTE